jgi:hypothetical protein
MSLKNFVDPIYHSYDLYLHYRLFPASSAVVDYSNLDRVYMIVELTSHIAAVRLCRELQSNLVLA